MKFGMKFQFQHNPLIDDDDVTPEGVFALKGWFKDDEEKEEKTHP